MSICGDGATRPQFMKDEGAQGGTTSLRDDHEEQGCAPARAADIPTSFWTELNSLICPQSGFVLNLHGYTRTAGGTDGVSCTPTNLFAIETRVLLLLGTSSLNADPPPTPSTAYV